MSKKLELDKIGNIDTGKLKDEESSKNKGGRPRKLNGKVDKKVAFYMTDKEEALLREHCENGSMKLSSFLRTITLKAIKAK